MTHRKFNYKLGDIVRCIDDRSAYQIGELLRVCYHSIHENGDCFLGFHDHQDSGGWASYHFEPAEIIEERPTIQVDVKEYSALLDCEMWWHAALLGNVREFCDWSDIVEHYMQMKKENDCEQTTET